MSETMPFNVGDMAVYPVQGVTEILGIETIEIAGTKSRFYVLRRLDSDDTIRVPVANVKRVGLRSLVTADEIEDVMTVLTADKIAIEEPNWMLPRYCETCTSLALTNSFHTGSAGCTKWRWTFSFRNFRWRRKKKRTPSARVWSVCSDRGLGSPALWPGLLQAILHLLRNFSASVLSNLR